MSVPHLTISIPHGLPSAVAKRSREIKAIGILYTLKGLHSGGYIKGFNAEAAAIANSFGFGRSKLLVYVKALVEMGLVERPNKKDLRLTSTKKVALHYGCCPDEVAPTWYPRTYKIAIGHLDQIESELKALAIAENLNKQRITVAKKLADQHLLSRTSLPSSPTPAARKRALRGYDPALALRASISLCEHNLFNDLPNAINPVCTLSRLGLARLFGRRSARTGTRTAKKLVAADPLSDSISRLRLHQMPLADFLRARTKGIYSGAHSWYKGSVFRRLSNKVEYTGGWQ